MISDYSFPLAASFFLLLATLSSWSSLFFKAQATLFSTFSKNFLLASNLLFALTLLSRWVSEHYFPLSNLYESLIFLSWAISSIAIFLEKKTRSRLVTAIATPSLFFLSSFSSLTLPIEMQKALPLVPSLQSNWLMMHVSMMMVSYATLIVGSLLAILYLALSFFLTPQTLKKEERLSPNESFTTKENGMTLAFSKVSLLESLDLWSYRVIGLGFPFLTIGIISGAVWANEAWGSYWSWDPKETWALITWLLFASYLHSRILKGWQGKKAAVLATVGFFVLWICYLGVNFLAKGLHSYGWITS